MQGNIWKLIIVTSALFCALGTGAWGADIYVDATFGNDANDGLSWGTAKRTIDDAFNSYISIGTADATVHITEGSYTELTISDLYMVSNWQFLGGYPVGGGGRNPALFESIIEGGIRVYEDGWGPINGLLFDGFTVQNGTGVLYACPIGCDGFSIWPEIKECTPCWATNERKNYHLGGGVLIISKLWGFGISNVTIQNCIIRNNSLTAYSAWWGNDEPFNCWSMQNVIYPRDFREGLGAAIYVGGINGLTIENNVIEGNHVDYVCYGTMFCHSGGVSHDEDIYVNPNCTSVLVTGNTFTNNQGIPETTSPDGDADGVPDSCDSCTDSDGDGYGNPGYARNACAEDNCPDDPNPGQEDGNGNGIGDVCEVPAAVPDIFLSGDTIIFSPAGAVIYDLIRGDLSSISDAGGTINLGDVSCLAENDMTGSVADITLPLPGNGYFYLLSNDTILSGYGSSSDGKERLPFSGDCF